MMNSFFEKLKLRNKKPLDNIDELKNKSGLFIITHLHDKTLSDYNCIGQLSEIYQDKQIYLVSNAHVNSTKFLWNNLIPKNVTIIYTKSGVVSQFIKHINDGHICLMYLTPSNNHTGLYHIYKNTNTQITLLQLTNKGIIHNYKNFNAENYSHLKSSQFISAVKEQLYDSYDVKLL